MGHLVEICDSVYDHTPLTVFGKEYYKKRCCEKRICQECLNAYLTDVSKEITQTIMCCLINLQMKELSLVEGIFREEDCTIGIPVTCASYMNYILPINFLVKSNMFYEVSDGEETVGKINISLIKLANDKFPDFNFTLEIKSTDTIENIQERVKYYISSLIKIVFTPIPEGIVQALMNEKSTKNYESSASSATGPSCVNCKGSTSFESYIYNNNEYCLDCMYEIVVQASYDNNITNEVGLSTNSSNSTAYAIVNTAEWKRSVINKYIMTMKSYGVNPGISHCITTVTG